jgi:hypothetical protein
MFQCSAVQYCSRTKKRLYDRRHVQMMGRKSSRMWEGSKELKSKSSKQHERMGY